MIFHHPLHTYYRCGVQSTVRVRYAFGPDTRINQKPLEKRIGKQLYSPEQPLSSVRNDLATSKQTRQDWRPKTTLN